MTDLNKLLSMLDSLEMEEVSYTANLRPNQYCVEYVASCETFVVELHPKRGYLGFMSQLKFDNEGKLIEWRNWE